MCVSEGGYLFSTSKVVSSGSCKYDMRSYNIYLTCLVS